MKRMEYRIGKYKFVSMGDGIIFVFFGSGFIDSYREHMKFDFEKSCKQYYMNLLTTDK
ncbi:hypothetical protein PQE75_gp062 [Bacillus phage vB_BcoS-136]|uniref:Uncharacterized protein n=1 Tax=Bacillus phage vB_BcoS-136 TaxID=2419619 RepID=A0A3G3BVE8_9CAUD|nr:hypothetical protein PQE75_gp062 [Bacillus phage vB_BcoS-136]AYP68194.1 hypothetical protein vBBcoS136_00062 [Bacillus phage vB_BcoS-136]